MFKHKGDFQRHVWREILQSCIPKRKKINGKLNKTYNDALLKWKIVNNSIP